MGYLPFLDLDQTGFSRHSKISFTKAFFVHLIKRDYIILHQALLKTSQNKNTRRRTCMPKVQNQLTERVQLYMKERLLKLKDQAYQANFMSYSMLGDSDQLIALPCRLLFPAIYLTKLKVSSCRQFHCLLFPSGVNVPSR